MEIKIEKEKSTAIEHPVLDVIKNRRSLRAFSTKPIEDEKIKLLFEAARWAPSSVNEQPWEYIYAHNDQSAGWNKLFEPLNESNRTWVQRAPLLIFSFARKNFIKNGRANIFAKYDLGASNAFLSLQAVALGLQTHQMGGYNAEKIIENFNLSEDVDLGPIIAVGYPGNSDDLPENLRIRETNPRERYKQGEFVKQ